VLVTATSRGRFIDRRRVELVERGLPVMPHHHEAQRLPRDEGVALVASVRASTERNARALVDSLAGDLPMIAGIALRACPTLPPTVEERIADYRAMCVADWVMYRQTLAEAAAARGWSVAWFDPKRVFTDAAEVLQLESLDGFLAKTGASVGRPWQRDHRLAMAAAIAAGGA
jgi:hypothetical protein